MPKNFFDDIAVHRARSWRIRIRRLIAPLLTATVQVVTAFFANGQRKVLLQYHRIDHERPPPDHWI